MCRYDQNYGMHQATACRWALSPNRKFLKGSASIEERNAVNITVFFENTLSIIQYVESLYPLATHGVTTSIEKWYYIPYQNVQIFKDSNPALDFEGSGSSWLLT